MTHRREGAALGAAGLEEVRTAKPRAVRPCPPRPPHPVRRGAHPSPSSPSLALRGPPGAPCSTRARRSRRAQGPAGEADAPASPPTAWITEPCHARDPSRNSSPEFYTLSNAVHMHCIPFPRVLLDAQEKFPSNRDAYNRINSVLVGVLQRHGTNGMYIFIQWKEIYDRELAHSIMTPASPQMCGGGRRARGSWELRRGPRKPPKLNTQFYQIKTISQWPLVKEDVGSNFETGTVMICGWYAYIS